MRILIVGLNMAPEPTGTGRMTGELAQWLARRGDRVEVVAAPPYYPAWRRDPAHGRFAWRQETIGPVTVHRCPLYVPRRPGGLARLVHLASFAASGLPVAVAVARRLRPDAVLAVVPTLLALPGARLAARAASARLWVHVQDLEIDAAAGLGVLAARPVRAALAVERRLLAAADLVTTIAPAMLDRLAAKGVAAARLALLPNWTDTEAIRPRPGPSPFRTALGLAGDAVVALYAGSLGAKQGLEVLVETADRLARDHRPGRPRVQVVVAGDGPARAMVEDAAGRRANLSWLPLQPEERLADLLALADLHLLPQRADAADLVLPSKLGGMLASGRPVVAAAAPGTALAAAVAGAGLVVTPGDSAALAAAIGRLAGDPALRARLGAAARARAEADWGRDAVLGPAMAEIDRRLVPAAPTPARRVSVASPRGIE